MNASSIWLIPRRSTVVIELAVRWVAWVMFLTIVPSAAVALATAPAVAPGLAGSREHDVRAAAPVGGLQIREVRDHERVARRRWELLDDALDVEVNDAEAARSVVEHPQVEHVA